MPHIASFKDMPLWQRSMQLAVDIYQLTAQLPATERLGLSANLQQSVIDIPTLIAAGTKRGRAGFLSACLTARQSASEVETLLLLIQQVYAALPVDDLLAEVADLQTGLTTTAQRLGHKPTSKPNL